MTLRLERVVWWARQGLLTGGAVLGAVCILAAVAAAAFGLRPLVFLSGSMSPAIETGALGIAHEVPASSLEPGDVVSVPTEGGERVTHRIVSVAMDGDEAELTLRGDANATADADTYRVAHADRVLFDVPLRRLRGRLDGGTGRTVPARAVRRLPAVGDPQAAAAAGPGPGRGPGPDGPGTSPPPR